MISKQKTVFVGLSGGVDSSVAALRLLREGYNVVGVFIKVWHPTFLVCNWEEERLDAMRVAAHLGIPFLTCDAEDAYRTGVAEYFIEEYKAGRTPNPDVMCNKFVKFGHFLTFARTHGADYIATGHYARHITENGTDLLARGIDVNKDQSYFLWTLGADELKEVLLPVGGSTKDVIRAEAEAAGIPVAQKKDSQGICFLGHIDIPEFLSHYVTLEEGAVLDDRGTRIGTHKGALCYTLGQRHGFLVESTNANRAPQYVISRNLENNTITVSTERPQMRTGEHVKLTACNWISFKPEVGKSYMAQFRYRQKPFEITFVSIAEDVALLSVLKPVEVGAAGQSCVLYESEVCIGGGIIS